MRVGVALLNWNTADLTLACIDSLLAGETAPWRVFVVDNGSTDGSQARLRAAGRDIELFESPDNLGFAAGTNVAVRTLIASGADAVWVLNNDTVVGPECLRELTAALAADPDVAAVTGKILYSSPPGRIWYAGAWWRHWTLTAPHRGQGQQDRGQFDVPSDVEFISGCCLLARAEAFARVGFFDEEYFAYSEDADWCLRAAHAGLRMRYVPAATLVHRVSASMRKNMLGGSAGSTPVRTYYLTTRNQIYIIQTHANRPWQWLTAMTWFMVVRSVLLCGMLALRRWDKAAAVVRGLREGFRRAAR